MRDPKEMLYYRAKTAHFDCCDILFFRTLVIGFTVLTTITGAVVVGLGLVMKGASIYQPDVISEFVIKLDRIATAMIVLGAIIIIMSIIGCLATVFENSWFTIIFVMTMVLCMSGQLSCGILTLFFNQEVRTWANEQTECDTCVEAYLQAFKYPTIAAIVMLAAIVVQLSIIASACKASRMRMAAKHEMLLSEFIPSHAVCVQEANKHCQSQRRPSKHYLHHGDTPGPGRLQDMSAIPYKGSPDTWTPQSTSRPRPSTGPANITAHNNNNSGPPTIKTVEGEIEVH